MTPRTGWYVVAFGFVFFAVFHMIVPAIAAGLY